MTKMGKFLLSSTTQTREAFPEYKNKTNYLRILKSPAHTFKSANEQLYRPSKLMNKPINMICNLIYVT